MDTYLHLMWLKPAFYSNDMIDREYSRIQVSVPRGYNASHLRKRGVTVRFFSEKIYSLGIAQIESMQGNIISVYDKERCVCDAIRDKQKRYNYKLDKEC